LGAPCKWRMHILRWPNLWAVSGIILLKRGFVHRFNIPRNRISIPLESPLARCSMATMSSARTLGLCMTTTLWPPPRRCSGIRTRCLMISWLDAWNRMWTVGGAHPSCCNTRFWRMRQFPWNLIRTSLSKVVIDTSTLCSALLYTQKGNVKKVHYIFPRTIQHVLMMYVCKHHPFILSKVD